SQIRTPEPDQTSGIELHHPPANPLEGVRHLEVLDRLAPGEHVLEEPTELRDIPLPCAEVKYRAAFRFGGLDLEEVIKSPVGGPHPEIRIRHEEGGPRRGHDGVGMLVRPLETVD